MRRRVGRPVSCGVDDRAALLSYTEAVRRHVCLACLCVALGARAAPAEPAPHPWGVEKFLTHYGMWGGCKKGSRVRHRIETTAVALRKPKTSVKETERRLVKVEGDTYFFEEGVRVFDEDGKPGPWKRERTEGYRGFKKTETKELGKATYRLGETSVSVTRLRVKVVVGKLEREGEFLVHAEHGVVRASLRSEYGTSEWRLVRLATECKVGMKKLVCREYVRKSDSRGVKIEQRLFLNARVPGYVVRAEYSLLVVKFVEQLLTFSRPK